jgi:hypothetical protein
VYNCVYLYLRIRNFLHLHSYCLYCNACYGGEERLMKVTYLFPKFLMLKMDLQEGTHDIKRGITVFHIFRPSKFSSGSDPHL